MAFNDRSIEWLAPLAAAGVLAAIAALIFRWIGISGWRLAGSISTTVIVGLAALWLALNAVNIIDYLREKRSR